MVTKKAAEPAATWGNETVDTLAGADVIDKPNLVENPFLITGYKFTYNDTRKISYVWVEFETTPGGERKMFNDSSGTGVRFEMEQFYEAKNPDKPFVLDTWYDTKLLCPRGLRMSDFETIDPNNGRKVNGRAFYLTRSGGRA